MFRNILSAGGYAVILASAAAATPPSVVQWSTAQGGNGHHYEVVFDPNISWQAASAAAAARSFGGRSGHLATFVTRAEQEYVIAQLGGGTALNALWLGGYQSGGSAEPYGGWNWVTGEAWAGVAPNDPNLPRSDFGFNNLYFNGDPEGYTITWWNSGGINDYVGTPNPIYADGNGGSSRGYIVEYGLAAVPEPGAWVSMIFGFGLVGLSKRRRRGVRPASV